MTQDEIIRMAREAGFSVGLNDPVIYAAHERFFNLAFTAGAAHEREKQAEQEPVAWRWSESNGERWFDWRTDWTKHDEALRLGFKVEYAYAAPASIESAVLAEREACAKVCDETKAPKIRDEWSAGQTTGCSSCAAAIRAREE